MELILTGEAIEAKEALSLGLVNRVVPADKLDSAVKEFASKVTLNSGPVLQMMKKTMLSGEGLSFQDALKSAKDIYLNQLMALEDTNEGLQAFRRAPRSCVERQVENPRQSAARLTLMFSLHSVCSTHLHSY